MSKSPAKPVFRFAPSPNGYLHLGHAYSALLNYDMAQKAGGRLLVRIEDIDPTRCRPEYEIAIRQDLEWLGILFERPVRRQSEYFSDYRTALMRLEEAGLLFTSFETRNEITKLVTARGPDWPHDPDGSPLYPGNARSMTSEERVQRIGRGEPYALRLDLETALERINKPLFWHETNEDNPRDIEAHPERWGDVVLGRKETPASYHLACVLDDALQGVTHVVRGMDLYESTSIHRLLQEVLGLPAPVYHHHKLVLDEDGKKLAKRTRSTTLRDLRVQGWSAKDVRQRVGL
ncbi:MAG TPA: tRNA glutamyl-Q(34) synthetase GluQRS [Xanthobacteraceae bacterium]|nr:tRNA glutamyl-Q(34) synthetase GluQRS [Xanthobacteraceae bacterium]